MSQDIIFEKFDNGYIINGDCLDPKILDFVKSVTNKVQLICTDPPYGNVVKNSWDKVDISANDFAEWMLNWTNDWSTILEENSAFYIWGGIGSPNFRPFFNYLSMVETETQLLIANLITWKKKRAYGLNHNYLFTREELVYLIKGDDIKNPRVFNIPLLDEKRGYQGYNKKYPAKSEYYRRSNVWTDINELFKNKIHTAQKPKKLYEVIIETHTNPNEWVLDMFAGSGVCAHAARKLKRNFILIEKDKVNYQKIIEIYKKGVLK